MLERIEEHSGKMFFLGRDHSLTILAQNFFSGAVAHACVFSSWNKEPEWLHGFGTKNNI